MKTSDPFGRVSQKRQLDYENFKLQLQTAEIINHDQLQGFKVRANQTLYKAVVLVVLVTLVFLVFFPAMVGAALIFGTLAVVWLLANYFKTRSYVLRFREELNDQ